MLGLSWTELLVVGVVALIVIGPKDLPVMMRRIGEFVGQVRRMGAEFQRELQRAAAVDDLKNIRKSVTEPLRQANAEIASQFNKMTPTGVQPTGVLAPKDPQAESVVDEIKVRAGMTPAASAAAPEAGGAPPAATAGSAANPTVAQPPPALASIAASVPVAEPPAAPMPKRARKPKAATSVSDDAVASADLPVVAAPAAKASRARTAKPKPAAEPAPAAIAEDKPVRKPRARKAG